MILEHGNFVLIAHRRLFEQDRLRYFVGKVDAYENGIARVSGFTWTQDNFHGKMIKKEGQRTKICSFSSGSLIVYVLPDSTKLSSVKIEFGKDNRILLSDGSGVMLDLSEGLHG